jgi:hypothetical protein
LKRAEAAAPSRKDCAPVPAMEAREHPMGVVVGVREGEGVAEGEAPRLSVAVGESVALGVALGDPRN